MTMKKQPSKRESIFSILKGELEEYYFRIIRLAKFVK